MPPRTTIQEIKYEDLKWKPGGPLFNDDAIKLSQLADSRGRKLTYEFLKHLQMGNQDNTQPVSVGVIPRLQESLSVLYRVPATRRLKRSGDTKLIEDDDPQSKTFSEISQRMSLDNVWQLVDGKRNIFRQCCLSFVESSAHASVQARIIEPHSIFRMPNAAAADVLEEDSAIALQVRDAVRLTDCLYQLWEKQDGAWRLWMVDGLSHLVGDQPYGESGQIPFDELPLLMIYDDLPCGVAYLPIPESRLDFALNINALVNDLAYLVSLEAHSIKAIATDDAKGVKATQTGPDKLWILPADADARVLAHTPQIGGAVLAIERALAWLCLSESLPADYFSAHRPVLTGPAMKAAERDLEARRQRQQPLAMNDERRAFKKIRAIHNYFAKEWGMAPLDMDLALHASFGRQWQPVDASELQAVWGYDLAIGAGSMIDYLQERRNVDRGTAIEIFEEVQIDRKRYPVEQQQNPAALIPGPRAPFGAGSATKVPGAFNPDLATSTDGASAIDATRTAISKV